MEWPKGLTPKQVAQYYQTKMVEAGGRNDKRRAEEDRNWIDNLEKGVRGVAYWLGRVGRRS